MKINILLYAALILSLHIFSFPVYANGLKIDSVSLTEQNSSDTGPHANTIKVKFDISWDNSWKDAENYDAVWVFIKYSTDAGATWHHATLETTDSSVGYDKNPAGYYQGSGTPVDIIVPDDNTTTAGGGYGCFIQRNENSSGKTVLNDVRLVWDYGQDNVTDTDADDLDTRIRVFGQEMVYIPEGAYYLGDGDGTGESADAFHQSGYDNLPVQITTTAKTVTWDSGGSTSVDGDGGITGNASYPTGYTAFYLMKYELSQGQYRDFLNTLTRAQQNTRTSSQSADEWAIGGGPPTTRSCIRVPNTVPTGPITFFCDMSDSASGSDDQMNWNEYADGEWAALIWCSWMDLCAYGDWAGLRPMTELEFEKACRGPNQPIYTEFAWGTTTINGTLTPTNEGQPDESATEVTSETACNHNNLGVYVSTAVGALRGGFAATSTSTRRLSGAGYYGNMELSGNAWERCVTLGNSTGRSFQGTHGDGVLTMTTSYEGNATNTDWPGIDGTQARGVTGATGAGRRGCGWFSSGLPHAQVSERSSAAIGDSVRDKEFGGRLARTSDW